MTHTATRKRQVGEDMNDEVRWTVSKDVEPVQIRLRLYPHRSMVDARVFSEDAAYSLGDAVSYLMSVSPLQY